MPRRTHNSAQLAEPVGPFSHAVSSGGFVFLSGQIAQDPTGILLDGDAAAQTRRLLANVSAILGELGLSLEDVVKVTVFLGNMRDFGDMNREYAECFTAPYPARTTVAVRELPMGALVEIEVVARAS